VRRFAAGLLLRAALPHAADAFELAARCNFHGSLLGAGLAACPPLQRRVGALPFRLRRLPLDSSVFAPCRRRCSETETAMLQKNHDLAPAADPKARAIFLQNALVPHHERLANGNNQSI